MASLAIKTVHMVETNAMEFRLILLALKGELTDKDVESARKLGGDLTDLRDRQMTDLQRKRKDTDQ